MGEGRTDEPRRTNRLTIAQAADQLGISEGAVRSRIKRGTLPTERAGARVYVVLGADQPTDRPPSDSTALISAKEETIAVLREQLEAERTAHSEARRLLAAALERIPAIEAPPEAPSEPSEAPETATEQPGRVEPQSAVEGTQKPRESHEMAMPEVGGGPLPHDQQTPSDRPWWRRVFGG